MKRTYKLADKYTCRTHEELERRRQNIREDLTCCGQILLLLVAVLVIIGLFVWGVR